MDNERAKSMSDEARAKGTNTSRMGAANRFLRGHSRER
jgi:hypothetical protein